MGANRHDSKAKALAKDLNRTPTKTQGVHWDKFWEEFTPHFNGLTTEEAMVHRCKVFVELMNVDKEFKFVDPIPSLESVADLAKTRFKRLRTMSRRNLIGSKREIKNRNFPVFPPHILFSFQKGII